MSIAGWPLRATFQPLGPFSRKKGLRPEAEIPLVIAMVPKGGLDRLSLGHPGQRPVRRGFGLPGSRASPYSSRFGRRPKPVRVLRTRTPMGFPTTPSRSPTPYNALQSLYLSYSYNRVSMTHSVDLGRFCTASQDFGHKWDTCAYRSAYRVSGKNQFIFNWKQPNINFGAVLD